MRPTDFDAIKPNKIFPCSFTLGNDVASLKLEGGGYSGPKMFDYRRATL